MAKAILVMDDMPECCADCQLADDDPSGLYCVFSDDLERICDFMDCNIGDVMSFEKEEKKEDKE